MRDRAGYGESQRDRTGDRRLDRAPDPALDRERISVSIVFAGSAHATTKGRGAKLHPPNHRFGQVPTPLQGDERRKWTPFCTARRISRGSPTCSIPAEIRCSTDWAIIRPVVRADQIRHFFQSLGGEADTSACRFLLRGGGFWRGEPDSFIPLQRRERRKWSPFCHKARGPQRASGCRQVRPRGPNFRFDPKDVAVPSDLYGNLRGLPQFQHNHGGTLSCRRWPRLAPRL